MFIPIDAKADVEGSKKGKLTPTQHAQLNAFCLANKTGIFDCLGRCEFSTISYNGDIATITFNSGYIVICGRLVECEAGTTFDLTLPTSGTETGNIVLRYDLSAQGNGEFEIDKKVGTLTQQDLNEHPIDGVYEFVLYQYTATSSSVTLTRNIEYLKSVEHRLESVEERLTKLGFKRGSIYERADSSGTPVGEIIRQGNFVLIHYNFLTSYSPTPTLYVYPDEGSSWLDFLPKDGNSIYLLHQGEIQSVSITFNMGFSVMTITSDAYGDGTVIGLSRMRVGYFGYEVVHNLNFSEFPATISSKTRSFGGTYVYSVSPSSIPDYRIVYVKIGEKRIFYGFGGLFTSAESYEIGDNVILYCLSLEE